MTYPLKFREKVFSIKEKQSLTYEETSKRFEISIRTLFRWEKKLEPCMRRNKPATKIDMQALLKDIGSNPDSYLWERAKKFKVSTNCIFAAIRRLGISYKKNSAASQSKRKGTYTISGKDKKT